MEIHRYSPAGHSTKEHGMPADKAYPLIVAHLRLSFGAGRLGQAEYVEYLNKLNESADRKDA